MQALKDPQLVAAVLADYRQAPISKQLRATLALLEKLTLKPAELDADDVLAVRAAGVTDQALFEAAYVAVLFNIMDRVADAFGFRPNDAQGLRWVTRILLGIGYGGSVVP